ncbi:hypothetical protein E4198_04185 [Streptomyces sp. RKND-216]|uniref:hypothetical protein n=1 Tax=Streptomyces sp. RKND-216 TaxID=2562581 RepID=UPI00109D8B42|nr:hypothetical protein [Streptomyces sp. RKND-216]THA24037.1 hypothetical protein E4198_04185 [Streptomyces sp. RKND-216]
MSTASGPLAFPSGRQYQEALQNTALCFHDRDLRGALPQVTKLGLPRPISGQFASVFSLTSSDGRRYALKCFTSHVRDQQDRYEAVSDKLSGIDARSLSQPWRIGFEYVPDGILVNGSRFPVLKMDWVEAVTLSSWLDSHHKNSTAVRNLAEHFALLTADLAAHDIAHGDLQHGNLLVASDGTFRLVDYDGMFVPALNGRHSTERGHRNYQSPARGDDDFDSTLDHFSNWVIYLALHAVSADPSLWTRLHEPDGEYLLLAEDDFRDPAGSVRLLTLLSHTDSTVRDLAEQIRMLAWQPLSLVPRLSVPVAPAHGARIPGPRAVTGRRPSWLDDHVSATTAPSPGASASATPTDSLPPKYVHRQVPDVLLGLLLPLAVLGPSALAVAELITPYVLTLSYGGSLGMTALAARTTRRRRPETTALRAHLSRLRERRRATLGPVRTADRLQRERQEFDVSETTRQRRLATAQTKLQHTHAKAVKAAEKKKVRDQQAIEKEITALARQRQTTLGRALRSYRKETIDRELGKIRLHERELTGIGRSLVQALAARGVRTAADFTGITLVRSGGRYNNVTALINTADGRRVDIKGIGENRARTLDAWRVRQHARVSSRAPSSLPPARHQSIEADFVRRETDLYRQRTEAEVTARRALETAVNQLRSGLARLDGENQLAARHASQQRQHLAQRLAQLGDPRFRLAIVEAEIAAANRSARALSFLRYLRFALIGR